MKLEDLGEATVLRNYRRNAMALLDSIQGGYLDLKHRHVEAVKDDGTIHNIEFTGLVSIDNVRAAAIADLEAFIAEQERKLTEIGVIVPEKSR